MAYTSQKINWLAKDLTMINVRKVKNGKRYDVRLRDPSGRLYTKSFSSKRDAETYEAKMLVEKTVGTWMDPRLGRVKLSEWSSKWMEQRVDLRPRTRELYSGLLSHHILPQLGRVELSKLSPTLVRTWYSKLLLENGPGASTAAKSYRLLRTIVQTAVADGILVRNPCQVDKAGVERADERPVPTIAELSNLADAIHPRMRLLVLLAAWCGLRRGELLGLCRSDIDLVEQSVRVDRAVVELANGERIVGSPKTDAGRRTVAIPPHLLPEVTSHLDKYVGEKPTALLFTGVKGGPLRLHVLQKAWVRAKEKTGLTKFHLHDLRHAGNTWAATTGASTKELMARMGHSSSAAAIRYQHASSNRDKAIAQALSALAISSEESLNVVSEPEI